MNPNPVIVALDVPNAARALEIAAAVRPHVGAVKVGKELFVAEGPAFVRQLRAESVPVFLDLKFHDIPNTVAAAVRSALALKPFVLNVHASGGKAMMAAAAEAARDISPRPLVIAVTVLTSLDDGDLASIGQNGPAADQVVRLARLTQAAGLDGVVCSAHEAAVLRRALGPDFKLIVPGIRPAGSATGDQKRVMGPKDAIEAGADFLVVGRPITEAADPAAAARAIVADIAAARTRP